MKQYRTRISAVLPCFSALFLFLAAACAPHAPQLTDAASRYHGLKLASGVPVKPGSVSWSPDGKLIAWTGKHPALYAVESGKETALPFGNADFFAWAPDGLLYVLSSDGKGGSVLSSFDVKTSRIILLAPVDADALYPLPDAKGLVLVSAEVKPLSFGTQVNSRIMLYNFASNTSRTIYVLSRTAMIRKADAALWTAWLHAGLNPLDQSLFFMEHITPPLIAGYTVVHGIDLASGEAIPVAGSGSRKRYISGSWSPDGRREVLSDADGRLEIRSRSGDSLLLDPGVTGLYPSWNPASSRIYAGGYLVDSSGTNSEQLIADKTPSIGVWSPDGTMLAVAAEDDLLLFRDIRSSFTPPDQAADTALSQKLSLLRDLLLDGSISRDEYGERRARLWEKPGGAQ